MTERGGQAPEQQVIQYLEYYANKTLHAGGFFNNIEKPVALDFSKETLNLIVDRDLVATGTEYEKENAVQKCLLALKSGIRLLEDKLKQELSDITLKPEEEPEPNVKTVPWEKTTASTPTAEQQAIESSITFVGKLICYDSTDIITERSDKEKPYTDPYTIPDFTKGSVPLFLELLRTHVDKELDEALAHSRGRSP